MKVFELMAALSGMPSGAEVSARRLMNLKEFAESESVDESLYAVEVEIKEAVQENEAQVYLYE